MKIFTFILSTCWAVGTFIAFITVVITMFSEQFYNIETTRTAFLIFVVGVITTYTLFKTDQENDTRQKNKLHEDCG